MQWIASPRSVTLLDCQGGVGMDVRTRVNMVSVGSPPSTIRMNAGSNPSTMLSATFCKAGPSMVASVGSYLLLREYHGPHYIIFPCREWGVRSDSGGGYIGSVPEDYAREEKRTPIWGDGHDTAPDHVVVQDRPTILQESGAAEDSASSGIYHAGVRQQLAPHVGVHPVRAHHDIGGGARSVGEVCGHSAFCLLVAGECLLKVHASCEPAEQDLTQCEPVYLS